MQKNEYIQVKQLLQNKNNWNQGHYSVDNRGKRCLSSADKAIRWCALTACNLFTKDYCRKELILASRQLGYLSITHLNDTGTHEEVLKMFDLAIGFCDVTTLL